MRCSTCGHTNRREARYCGNCGQPLALTPEAQLIADRTRDFTGRGWVFQALDAWLADPHGKRGFLLTGEPGSGKTAVAARLVQMSRGEVAAAACPRLGVAAPRLCPFLPGVTRQHAHPAALSLVGPLDRTCREIRYIRALAQKVPAIRMTE